MATWNRTYETNGLVGDSQVETNTSSLGRDEDNPNRILGAREPGNRVIPIELGHATSVGKALDTLRFEMILNEIDKGDELREDDDLVRVISAKPLVDQLAIRRRSYQLLLVERSDVQRTWSFAFLQICEGDVSDTPMLACGITYGRMIGSSSSRSIAFPFPFSLAPPSAAIARSYGTFWFRSGAVLEYTAKPELTSSISACSSLNSSSLTVFSGSNTDATKMLSPLILSRHIGQFWVR